MQMTKNHNTGSGSNELTPQQIRAAEELAVQEENARIAEAERAEQEQRDKPLEKAIIDIALGRAKFVPMHKGGVTLDVHPTCVKSHQDAGWRVKES
jgi:hypothetical protein